MIQDRGATGQDRDVTSAAARLAGDDSATTVISCWQCLLPLPVLCALVLIALVGGCTVDLHPVRANAVMEERVAVTRLKPLAKNVGWDMNGHVRRSHAGFIGAASLFHLEDGNGKYHPCKTEQLLTWRSIPTAHPR